MVALADRYEELAVPNDVRQLEEQLFSILLGHYFVRGQTFDAISSLDLLRHELGHLLKAIEKVQSYLDDPSSTTALQQVRGEVAPDLCIYALEASAAFKTQWWCEVPFEDLVLSKSATTLCESPDNPVTVARTAMGLIIHASGRAGEVCDRADHSEVAAIQVNSEIVKPLLLACISLMDALEIDFVPAFKRRLEQVAAKYTVRRAPQQ